MNTKQRGGLLRRKKQSAEDKAFTPEKVQQRVKEYEEVKNKPKKTSPQPDTSGKDPARPVEKFDENKDISFSQAFKKASDAGDGLFKWNGKMYNTKKGKK